MSKNKKTLLTLKDTPKRFIAFRLEEMDLTRCQ